MSAGERPSPHALALLADLQSFVACDGPLPPMSPAETAAWKQAQDGETNPPELIAAWYEQLAAAGHVTTDPAGRYLLTEAPRG